MRKKESRKTPVQAGCPSAHIQKALPPRVMGPGRKKGVTHLDPKRTRCGSDLPNSFIEFDGEADNLVIAQGPLLLLQDLATVFIGAIGDCKRREL